MSIFGKGCFGNDDTILWFIILFLLIFCGPSDVRGIRDNSCN